MKRKEGKKERKKKEIKEKRKEGRIQEGPMIKKGEGRTKGRGGE